MNTAPSATLTTHREQPTTAANGWLFVFIVIALLALGLFALVRGAQSQSILSIVAGLVVSTLTFVMLAGFFTLQPNESAVLTLFGAYKGTTRQNGFLWANPFYRKLKISLRVRNLNGEKLKVNDKRGNPVEIAVVIVWRIKDTAQAVFDVDSYDNFIRIQSNRASGTSRAPTSTTTARRASSRFAAAGSRSRPPSPRSFRNGWSGPG